MMIRCMDCGLIFPAEDTRQIHTSWEAYYDAPVPGYSPLILNVCPRCDSEQIEEIQEDEEDGEEIQPGALSE